MNKKFKTDTITQIVNTRLDPCVRYVIRLKSDDGTELTLPSATDEQMRPFAALDPAGNPRTNYDGTLFAGDREFFITTEAPAPAPAPVPAVETVQAS